MSNKAAQGEEPLAADQPRLERCKCGAIVEVLPTPDGDEVRLEAGRWPWPDLPDDARFVIVEGIAQAAAGLGSQEQLVRLLHDRACPRVVRRRPADNLIGAVWAHHIDYAKPRPYDQRAAAWAAQRREGVSTDRIAVDAGVTHQWVSRVTNPLGPFPRPGTPSAETVDRWITARREGMSASAIALHDRVPVHRVRDSTRHAGPFTRRVHGAGELGITEIAQLLGVGHPTVYRWQRLGRLPEPIKGRPGLQAWDRDQVQRWAAEHLTECAQCGARPMDLLRHTAMKHRGGR